MKFFKKKNNLTTLLLSLFILFCLIWIVRLEVEAASLLSRVQEHDDWLSKNKDVLEKLDDFSRSVGNSSIMLNKTDAELSTGTTFVTTYDKEGFLQKGNSFLRWDDKGIHIEAGNNKKSTIDLSDDGVKIKTGASGDFYIELSHSADMAKIKKGDALLYMGNTNIGDGIAIGETKTGTVGITKTKGIGIGSRNDTPITINCANDFAVKLTPKDKLVEIINGKAKIQLGTHKFGEGILQYYGSEGSIAITKDKGVGIAGDKVNITGKNNLSISFDGDIDIKAKGNVNITGKKVNINE